MVNPIVLISKGRDPYLNTQNALRYFSFPDLFCQLAVGRMRYPGAEAARFLSVTTSAVVRAAYSEELPELQKYL